MKIAIVSDFHLGFASDSARGKDAFLQARQALEIAAKECCELVLFAGDFFDERIPLQETWHDSFELLSVLLEARKPEIKIFKEKHGKKVQANFEGIPFIAIHGTHELRSKDYKNALQVLERAGFLLYLHASKAIIEKGNERIAVHGLGGVPEKRALEAFKAWNPAPEKGCKNILLFHQSLKEFLPFDDEMTATLSISDLPKGFDLLVDGHLHWSKEESCESRMLLLPGSTVSTQLKNLESKKLKGLYLYDSSSGALSFKEIPIQRKLFYHKLSFEDSSPQEVLQKCRQTILEDLQKNSKELAPMIRIKCTGTLKKGFVQSDILFKDLEQEFKEKAIFSLDKAFSLEPFKKTIQELRELQAQKKSVAAMGLELLEENLEKTSFSNAFDVKRVFELLAQKDLEKAEKVLMKKTF